MCKHAAAVLYGVGSRLDTSPELLFRLRGVDEAELIAADKALPRGTAAGDTLADGNLAGIFGIDLDPEQGVPAPSTQKPAANTSDKQASRTKKKKRQRAGSSNAGTTGAHIAALRERCGFSVAEFAALLRVSGATVRRWEATPGPLDLRARPREALTALRREIEQQGDRRPSFFMSVSSVITDTRLDRVQGAFYRWLPPSTAKGVRNKGPSRNPTLTGSTVKNHGDREERARRDDREAHGNRLHDGAARGPREQRLPRHYDEAGRPVHTRSTGHQEHAAVQAIRTPLGCAPHRTPRQ